MNKDKTGTVHSRFLNQHFRADESRDLDETIKIQKTQQWLVCFVKSVYFMHSMYSLKNTHHKKNKINPVDHTLECFSKWGRERFSKPLGTRDPLMACWPTQAIIWEILMKDPVCKQVNEKLTLSMNQEMRIILQTSEDSRWLWFVICCTAAC